MSSPVLDGVFAVYKPPTLSSAALGNQIKHTLTKSNLFKPHIDSLNASRSNHKGRTPRSLRGKPAVKIGHGGTLDPGASGVVTFGVGAGTKALGLLQKGSWKGYEAVLLFGAGTDSFDVLGRTVGRKGWDGVTRSVVEEKLAEFRGKILQRPSVYSALSRGGVRMYEYAREGKEIPELEKREMVVEELEVVEWLEGGKHGYHWPKEIEKGRKEAFVKALRFEEIGGVEVVEGTDEEVVEDGKRKRDGEEAGSKKRPRTTEEEGETEVKPMVEEEQPQGEPCPAPACVLRMTVSSGFYVRSLCHDLGVAVGSLGCMAKLERTRQACFSLDQDNVIPYADFEAGEEVWGPKVAKELEAWAEREEQLRQQGGDETAEKE